ncbi:L-ornithine N5-acetyltransferase NATA1 [Cyphellophora attinorum]|uniref:L-ornithine N5-acetyltransferase NATA1 n=1 Tax=Cyphellophora attinorum TaxID=1664694 RepID=A0A0N1HRC8_9EURO|nr:L-ornithine N5-acetyltransferase NATA1 [Phialophora attinorum]KPI40772.1 L-ornithine N5-acetyltransferase NATA1 [Phialophora attinorum]
MPAPIQTSSYTIRYATQSDVPTVLALLRELAEHERQLSSCRTTEEMLIKTLAFPSFPDQEQPSLPVDASSATAAQATEFTKGYARALLVSPTPKYSQTVPVIGLAVYHPAYSTWTGPGIYIEDMIITASHRRQGHGRALMSALAREVEEVAYGGMGRLSWKTLRHEWNQGTRDFFVKTIGALETKDYVEGKVDGEDLVGLAERG